MEIYEEDGMMKERGRPQKIKNSHDGLSAYCWGLKYFRIFGAA